MSKENLIALEENFTCDSFQALRNLQIPIWSFKANMVLWSTYMVLGVDSLCWTFKRFGTFK